MSVLLHFVSDVAREQHRHAAEAELEDDRIVVADLLALPVRHRRVVDAQLDAAKLEAIAALKRSPAGTSPGGGLVEALGRFVVGDRHSLPHLARRERPHQRQRAADVIRVAVSDGEIVEAGDRHARAAPGRARGRRYRSSPRTETPPASTISRRPLGSWTKHRVTLTNIHHRQAKPAVAALARQESRARSQSRQTAPRLRRADRRGRGPCEGECPRRPCESASHQTDRVVTT